MNVNVYTIGKKQLIGTYETRNVYESRFYFRNMPTLSAKKCSEVLNAVSQSFKISSKTFVLEDSETGYTGIQEIHRGGTVLNF